MKTRYVNTDRNPRIPYRGWKVLTHQKGGRISFDISAVTLKVTGEEASCDLTGVHMEYIRRMSVSGREEFIPVTWKQYEHIQFTGTMYGTANSDLAWLCLCYSNGRWCIQYLQRSGA